MQIAKGLEMLEISAVVMGRTNTIYPSLFWDEYEVVLVDTGYPGQLGLFKEAIVKAGYSFEQISKIIITHQDIDHIGNLPVFIQESPRNIEVLTSAAEKPYIQGEQRLVKMTGEAIAKAVSNLPEGISEERRQAFKTALENPPQAKVDQVLADEAVLPYGGGITVITTPGHTPGHLCLYHQPSKTLIAGDLLNIKDNQLSGPIPQYSQDMELALKSLQKINRYRIEAVISYHGGLYRGNVNQRITELTRS